MTQKCDFRTHFPVQGVCMSAHYCLVTVWSQSGSSREGKAECHCPVGVVMIWKIIIIVDYSVFVGQVKCTFCASVNR